MTRQPASLKLTFIHFSRSHCATGSVSPSQAISQCHHTHCQSMALLVSGLTHRPKTHVHIVQLGQSLHLMQCNSVSLSISCNKSTSSVGDPHTHCQSVDHLVSVLTNRPKTHVHNVQFSQSLHLRQSVNIVSSPLTHTAMALLVSVLTLICPFKK